MDKQLRWFFVPLMLLAGVLSAQILQPILGGVKAYYVDSVSGNDSTGDGSAGAPFATISKLTTVDASAPRPIWKLKMDGVWREQLTVPRNRMTIQSYGSGTNRPLLDASDPVTAASWTLAGGQTVTYQATVPIVGNATTWVSAWANSVRMTRASSIANCEATAGSYYPSSDTTNGNITLYVHLSDGSNPASKANGWIEYSRRQFGLDTYSVQYATVRGIWTRRNLHNDGSLRIGKFGSAYDSLASEGTKHNVLNRTGTYLSYVTAQDAYYTVNTSSLFVYNEDSPSNEGVTYDHCTAQFASFRSGYNGWDGHVNVSGSFGAVTFTQSTVVNGDGGFGGGAGTINASYLTATTCRNAVVFSGTSNTVDHLTVTGATNRAISIGSSNQTWTVTNATLTGNGAGTYGIFMDTGVSNTNLTVSGSSFGSFGYAIYTTAGAQTIAANNNSYSVTFWYYLLQSGTVALTSDYNSFAVKSGRNYWQWNGTNYNSFTLWQGTGQDAHSN